MRQLNNTFSRAYGITVFLLLFGVLSAAAQTSNNDQLKNIRIDNFGQIAASYYRGAQPEEHDYADLATLGIKTVINLTSDDADINEKALVENSGMKYVQIPMTTHKPPTSSEIAEFLSIVKDPNNQPIYVHCVGGKHRTGVMTAAYRMTEEGWSAEKAFQEMKKYKFGADFLHPEFKKFVYSYYTQLAAAKTISVAPVGGCHQRKLTG